MVHTDPQAAADEELVRACVGGDRSAFDLLVTRHQRQIHSYGPDPRVSRCKGSMSAVVEEAS